MRNPLPQAAQSFSIQVGQRLEDVGGQIRPRPRPRPHGMYLRRTKAHPLDGYTVTLGTVQTHPSTSSPVRLQNPDSVRIAIAQSIDWQPKLGVKSIYQSPSGEIRIALAGHQDARIAIIEAILRKAGINTLFLYDQDALGIAAGYLERLRCMERATGTSTGTGAGTFLRRRLHRC